MSGRLNLLYIHASEDEPLRLILEAHLSSLTREGLIDGWHVGMLMVGEEVNPQLAAKVAQVQVVVLLLTADFMASAQCQALLAQVQRERLVRTLRVIPVLARPVDWCGIGLDGEQALPRNGQAVTLWPNQDAAWVEVAEFLRGLLSEGRDSSRALPRRAEGSTLLSDKSTNRRKLFNNTKHVIFIILLWEKCRDLWSRVVKLLSGLFHTLPVVIHSSVIAIVIATGTAAVVSMQSRPSPPDLVDMQAADMQAADMQRVAYVIGSGVRPALTKVIPLESATYDAGNDDQSTTSNNEELCSGFAPVTSSKEEYKYKFSVKINNFPKQTKFVKIPFSEGCIFIYVEPRYGECSWSIISTDGTVVARESAFYFIRSQKVVKLGSGISELKLTNTFDLPAECNIVIQRGVSVHLPRGSARMKRDASHVTNKE